MVDDRVGNGWEKEKIHFMGVMAKTIMRHMEMVREVEEHRRGMKMSRGLASFVEGRSELAEADADLDAVENTEGTKVAGQFETDTDVKTIRSIRSTKDSVMSHSTTSIEHKAELYSAALSKTEEALLAASSHTNSSSTVQTSTAHRPGLESNSEPNSFGGTSVSISSPRGTLERAGSSPGDDVSETTSIKVLFSRAANLIYEAFEVDGGAVFYDAQTGFSSEMGRKASQAVQPGLFREDLYNDSPGDSLASDNDAHSSGEQNSDEGETNVRPATLPHSGDDASPGLGEGMFSRATSDSKKIAEVLGFSTAEASSIHGDSLPGGGFFSPFAEKALHVLLKRYPRGKLWTFDSDGAVSSSSEEEIPSLPAKGSTQRSKDLRRLKLRSAKTKSDARFLAKHFPGVRQLLFVPLWDAGRSRWLSGCFAWSTEPTRILSKQSELAFLTAFGNSVMAEWSRIDTEIADQKKGDFIGSISHELRSPLHGILASAEFLDEMTDGRAKQLVETIDSCGRTLLDTINHILDYSKINHFERNWRKSKRSGNVHIAGAKSGPMALRQSDLPMLNLFQDIDLSVLCEEVVDSVFAGHVFQNVTASSFDMVSDINAKKMIASSDEIMGSQQTPGPAISVILDIDLQNYHFITQPGALRRLIMNLLGNALKYTSHGYVRIKLDAKEMEDMRGSPNSAGTQESVPRSMVTLTVTDTGKGISPEFLRSKLFMPFAQENSLSSGTGLGLSIVRKIVALLEGEITIDSEVGRGTQVQVKLPLLREMPKTADSMNSTSTKSMLSMPRDVGESIALLRVRVTGQKASLSGFDVGSKDPVLRKMGIILKTSITTFLVKFYGLTIVPLDHKPNIIVCNEANPAVIASLAHKFASTQKVRPSIIVLCAHNSRFDHAADLANVKCNVSFVAKPVGPLKLAKTITHCLDGAQPIVTPGIDGVPMPSESTDLSNVFEELMLSPRGGEVLDNSRMASDSDNARKALESPTPNALVERTPEFPFPHPTSKSSPTSTKSVPTKLQGERQLPNDIALPHPSTTISPLTVKKTPPSKADSTATPKIKFPTLLVVDDNQINLSLLSTYLNRRKYETVHESQNGLEAVQQVEKRPAGYDIIFMDITMPVLDGFGATRQIREIEERRRRRSAVKMNENQEGASVPALIIAFTGRSSIEDQTEAMRVGIDLFMTKPVAFKEVGKIIDNWLANKKREATGSVGSAEGASEVPVP